jgi:hypothetical protein
VVGAPNEDSGAREVNGDQTNNGAPAAGAAYVFVRNGATWTQQAYLKAFNASVVDGFGAAVAISRDTVVVGASAESSNANGVNGDGNNNNSPLSGAAYVFVRSGTNWTQQAYLKASNNGSDDHFGGSVAVSGDTALVGALFECAPAGGMATRATTTRSAGAAYIFVRNGLTGASKPFSRNADATDQSARLWRFRGTP